MNVYFAVVQKTLNPLFFNIWINGSNQKELINEKRLLEFVNKQNPELVISLKETVLRNNSFYLIDFVNSKIYLLSSSSFNSDSTIKGSLLKEYEIAKSVLDSLKEENSLSNNEKFKNLLNSLTLLNHPDDRKTFFSFSNNLFSRNSFSKSNFLKVKRKPTWKIIRL